MLRNAKKQVMKIDGTTMNIVSFGKGKKPLVFIPGLSLQRVKGYTWIRALMYRKLGEEYRVYVFERKNEIPEGYTIADMADDVARGMRRMGIRSADVLGISQGGMIAQYLTLNYPAMVKKLVLAVTTSRQNELMRSVVATWIELAKRDAYEAIMMDMMEKVYSVKFAKRFKGFYPFFTKVGKRRDITRFINMSKACFSLNTYDELERITCPVFVIGGKLDRILTGEASEEIAEKLNCKIYMYEKYGHSAYEEARDFQKRILAFLKGV